MSGERPDLGDVIAEHHALIRRGPARVFVLPPGRAEWEDAGFVGLPPTLPDLAPTFRRPFDWRRDLDPRRDF